jgi:hypothetical protein
VAHAAWGRMSTILVIPDSFQHPRDHSSRSCQNVLPLVAEVAGTNELERKLCECLIRFVLLGKNVGNIIAHRNMFDVDVAGIPSVAD